MTRTEKKLDAGAYHDGRIKRFTKEERRVILQSRPDSTCGLLDELEMINFQTAGSLWPREAR